MPRRDPTPYAVATRGLLRTTVLDAVGVLVAGGGWATTTLTQVARTAGVSRQTLYNEFGSRDALAQAFVLREVDRFLLEVETSLRAEAADVRRALASALATFLRTAADNVVVKAIVSGDDGDGLLPLVTTQGGAVNAVASHRLGGLIAQLWPDVPDVDLLADVVVRLAISYAALPAGDPEHTAANVARLLAPFVRPTAAG